MAETAEQALDNDDGKCRAHDALPQRHGGAEIQPEQKPRDNGAHVADGLGSAGDKIEEKFRHDSADNARGEHAERLHTEDDDRSDGSGHQRDDDVKHYAAAGI